MMTRSPADLLPALLARLALADPSVELVAGRPTSQGWVELAEVVAEPALVDRWIDSIRAASGGPDTVAGSFLASWLSGVVVGPLYRSVARMRRAWPSHVSDLLVRQHDDGWFDGLAIAGTAVRMLPDDPEAGHPDAVVLDDLASLRRSVLVDLGQTLGLIFATARRSTRLGLPAMWGAVADSVVAAAVADARALGADPNTAFADAIGFVDDLAEVAPIPRVRPALVDVAWSGGVAREILRCTCCLWYRTQPDPDPRGEGFCDSCPRRDPVDQVRRWAVSQEAAATGDAQ